MIVETQQVFPGPKRPGLIEADGNPVISTTMPPGAVSRAEAPGPH